MTFYSLIQYLNYRWKALDRHGVHSPFAYTFNERVLNNNDPLTDHERSSAAFAIIKAANFPSHFTRLIYRIVAYYNCNTINTYTSSDDKIISKTTSINHDATWLMQCVLLNIANPDKWLTYFELALPGLNNNGIIAISSIHASKQHTECWHMLCADPQVKLSIDLYGIGLLFFKSEFKEQQTLFLKYENKIL